MARYAMGISAKWLKYIPQLAAIYAFYEYYQNVGVEGIKAYLEALTFEGIKVQAKNIVSGFAAFIIGDVIATKVRDKYVKTAVRSISYYVGAKQLAAALDAGSTVSRVAAVTSGTTTVAGTATNNMY